MRTFLRTPNGIGYDQGLWTPVLWDSSLSSSESQTYTTQIGHYTKIGKLVIISGHLAVNSLGTLTTSDTAYIGGLPFTPNTTSGDHGTISIGFTSSLAKTAGYSIHGAILGAQTYITLYLDDSATSYTGMLISELSAGGSIGFTGTYTID